MTEADAMLKWCPFARLVVTDRYTDPQEAAQITLGAATFNRLHTGPNSTGIPNSASCIGSRCMAWISTGLTDNSKREPTGHCGLAGTS